MTASPSSLLDIEALLSRGYRPARVAQLQPKEALQDPKNKSKVSVAPDVESVTASTDNNNNNSSNNASTAADDQKLLGSSRTTAALDSVSRRRFLEQMEASRLVHGLVAETEHFKDAHPHSAHRNYNNTILAPYTTTTTTAANATTASATKAPTVIPPHLHEIEMGDWEKLVQWGDEDDDDDNNNNNNNKQNKKVFAVPTPWELAQRPRNPHLDNLVLDDSNIGWTPEDCARLINDPKKPFMPLILELGVAGTSVARPVLANNSLWNAGDEDDDSDDERTRNGKRAQQHPASAEFSDEYQQRRRKEEGIDNNNANGALIVVPGAPPKTKGSLHQDKVQMAAFIEKRQKLRAQMAKDKTNRVTEAMGTLALGVSGKGRTITSSLMGPGGTERSGRPSREGVERHGGAGGYHQTEYIQQLDLIVSHTLVRDLSKIMRRQYNRPKLPLAVVRPDLQWQFQIRYMAGGGPGNGPGGVGGGGGANAAAAKKAPGAASVMMGMMHTAGAASQRLVRSEADLSPTEGTLVLMEFCEERPLVQMTKGMACKIVNYYRGDKAQCPVSAGGGDRPARRKRETNAAEASSESSKSDRLPRLKSSGKDTIMDWIGKLPKRTPKERAEQEAIEILPDGVTEILHPKVHGPFIGEVEQGQTISGLISNMFVAPIFLQAPESTDFIMVLSPPSGAARPGQRDYMGVVLRDMPKGVYTVGQVEPRVRVYAPNSQGEKNFVAPFVSYQIARALTRSQGREGHGLRFDELQHSVCPNLELAANALRQRLKHVAVYDKNTGIWTTKQIGVDDYTGVESLGKSISPESVAAFEIASAAAQRLTDLGIQNLYAGAQAATSVGVALLYLRAQLNAARDLAKHLDKMLVVSKASTGTNKGMTRTKIALYEAAAKELDHQYKTLKQKIEVAQFIHEQLLLAPWHLTGDFIEVHKKGEGTGMMKLTGLGDPSGNGEGFSFLREVDSKPSKSVGNAQLSAQMKKITGTEDDLRKLTMKQMASLLRSYGMGQKQIDTLKRWDRVHCIRDLSTKAASDGIGDGLERFARGEKMKLSEQKQMYRDRVRVIWRRQIAALSMADDKGAGGDGDGDNTAGGAQATSASQKKNAGDKDVSDSDSDDDDDFFAAELEDEMMDRAETNQLVADRAAAPGGGDNEGANRGQLRAAIQDKEMTKDARELAALKRQREEERAAQGGLQSDNYSGFDGSMGLGGNRKVIRKKIVKTFPDGKQTTTFKYILQPAEVGKIQARLDAAEEEGSSAKPRPFKYETNSDERPPGQATWEDEDDIEYASSGRLSKRRGGRGGRRGGRATPKGGLQFGKLKTKVTTEERMRKRRREEDEMDTYIPTAKRKGTSNRRERGSIRERRPHVIFADRLEAIRAAVESRPDAGPFVKPVNSKLVPKYYETISEPIDLSTIRDKIKRYDYRSADAMMKDFDLMRNNAIKFNGQQNRIALAAVAIHEFAMNQIESSRSELSALEVAVGEQLSEPKPKKKQKTGTKKKKSAGTAKVDGFSVNLGNLSNFKFVDSDSGDEVSFTGE